MAFFAFVYQTTNQLTCWVVNTSYTTGSDGDKLDGASAACCNDKTRSGGCSDESFLYSSSSLLENNTLCKGCIKTGETPHRFNYNLNFSNAAIYRISRTSAHLLHLIINNCSTGSIRASMQFNYIIQWLIYKSG